MVEALRGAEGTKRKSGRPRKLSIANQVLMTLNAETIKRLRSRLLEPAATI